MNTFLMPSALQRGWTNAGVPAAGCKLYTYEAGTTTPKATYQDAAGTVPHENPIVLDAKGEALIYWSGAYKVDLRTAAGVQITGYPVDDYITPDIDIAADTLRADLAQATGAGNVNVTQAGSGVVRTALSKMNDTVSVFDFMTPALIADALSGAAPVLDHTAAVQAAVNFCILKNRDLEVPGLCRLTAPIMINRAVDGLPYYSYFTIRSNSGGGFYVDTAINMFSSSLVNATDPVSQLVRWNGLRFITGDSDLLAYVIEGIKFLRVEFSKCNFERIKCLASTRYVQSIYLMNCNARRWAGTFFDVTPQGYDVQVIGGLYEASYGPGFRISSPIGCKFITILEGIQGTALSINGAQGVDISTYFEGNTLDIDCRTGGLANNGIKLHGSYFSHADAVYSVKWGECYGCTSSGNWHTWNMHDLQANSYVEINDQAQVNISNTGDVVTHVGYRQGLTGALEVRGAASGLYTVSGLTSKFTRMGNRMNIEFICTLTSTGSNPADELYIPSLFPTNAATPGMLCGSVEVAGSSLNNGISPLYISSAVPLRVESSIAVLPANIAGDAYTVRGHISYQVAV